MSNKDETADSGVSMGEGAGVDTRLAQELIEQAHAEGVSLVGPDGLLRRVTKTVLESALQAELEGHLGYERGDEFAKTGSNERNGSSSKTVRTDVGDVRIDVPRDREGTFEPRIVPKYSRRLEGFDEVISPRLVAGGMCAHWSGEDVGCAGREAKSPW